MNRADFLLDKAQVRLYRKYLSDARVHYLGMLGFMTKDAYAASGTLGSTNWINPETNNAQKEK